MIRHVNFQMILLALFILVGSASSALGQKTEQPNVLVIFVDDLGWQDLSEPFYKEKTPLNRRFHTPNLELLAKESVKFTDAYATPVCTPSRVSFLTGMNAARHRVTLWTHPEANHPTDNPDELLDPPAWNINGLSAEEGIPFTYYATPLPEILKNHGYYTIHIGKAHWGAAGTPGASPLNLGFMVNVAGHSAGHPQSYYGEANYGNFPTRATYQAVPDLMEYHGTPTFLTSALTKEAIKALREPLKREEPFFMHFSNYAVHVPIQADPRFVDKYLTDGLDSLEAAYASLVEGYDESIGELVSFLKQEGVYDNTVIVFVSDNGGLSLAPQRSGESHTQNLPLNVGKGSVYEGGIRVPLLIKKAKGEGRNTIDAPVIMEDLFPTILELTNTPAGQLAQKQVDGKSLMPLLNNKVDESWNNRPLVWHVPNKWILEDGPGINFYSAVRQGDYKLIYDMKGSQVHLYNLKKDIGERYDLAGKENSKVKAMSTLLSKSLKQYQAQMPTYQKSKKIVPYPDELAR